MPGIPHGVSCMLDQGFRCTPAGKEFLLPASPPDECPELLRRHESCRQRFKSPGPRELHIHPDGLVMKSNAQAIAGVAQVERLLCALRFAIGTIAETDFTGMYTNPAGYFAAENRANECVVPATSRCHGAFLCRQDIHICKARIQIGNLVYEVIHSEVDNADGVGTGIVDPDGGAALAAIYFTGVGNQG